MEGEGVLLEATARDLLPDLLLLLLLLVRSYEDWMLLPSPRHTEIMAAAAVPVITIYLFLFLYLS